MSASEGRIRDTIRIGGMTCKGCARTLENEFRKFADIDYSVNLSDNTVVVTFSPTAYAREDFEKAIESRGFRVEDQQS